jgi:membrane glycosyltransferase
VGYFRENIERMKEPMRKHEISAAGVSWMKREMRKPFRVMFWISVVCVGFALVGNLVMFLVDSKDEVVKNNINQQKTRIVSEKRAAEDELRRAKTEYAKARAELEAVEAWAKAELTKSNAKLQAVVSSVVTVDGELGIPEKEAQKYIDDAESLCTERA